MMRVEKVGCRRGRVGRAHGWGGCTKVGGGGMEEASRWPCSRLWSVEKSRRRRDGGDDDGGESWAASAVL